MGRWRGIRRELNCPTLLDRGHPRQRPQINRDSRSSLDDENNSYHEDGSNSPVGHDTVGRDTVGRDTAGPRHPAASATLGAPLGAAERQPQRQPQRQQQWLPARTASAAAATSATGGTAAAAAGRGPRSRAAAATPSIWDDESSLAAAAAALRADRRTAPQDPHQTVTDAALQVAREQAESGIRTWFGSRFKFTEPDFLRPEQEPLYHHLLCL